MSRRPRLAGTFNSQIPQQVQGHPVFRAARDAQARLRSASFLAQRGVVTAPQSYRSISARKTRTTYTPIQTLYHRKSTGFPPVTKWV